MVCQDKISEEIESVNKILELVVVKLKNIDIIYEEKLVDMIKQMAIAEVY